MDLLTLIANFKVSSTKIKESLDVKFKRVVTLSIILDWYGNTYCVFK